MRAYILHERARSSAPLQRSLTIQRYMGGYKIENIDGLGFYSWYSPKENPAAKQGAGFTTFPLLTNYGQSVALLQYLGVEFSFDQNQGSIIFPSIELLNSKIDYLKEIIGEGHNLLNFKEHQGPLSGQDIYDAFLEGFVLIQVGADGEPDFETIHDLSFHFANFTMGAIRTFLKMEIVQKKFGIVFLDLTANMVFYDDFNDYMWQQHLTLYAYIRACPQLTAVH